MPAAPRRSHPLQPGVGSFLFGWGVRYGVPPVTESRLIALARRHGLAVVQLGDNLPIHEMDRTRRARLRAAIARAGLTLEIGARGLTTAHLATYIALAAELDVRLLRFVVDRDSWAPSPDTIVSIVSHACPALAAAQLTLALENHDRVPAAVLRGIVDAVGSPRVGVCLDTANSFGAGEGLAEVTRVLAPVTVNLHVKDVAIARLPHQMGFSIEGRPLGRGVLPIAATIAAVRAAGRCRSLIVEGWTPQGATLDETLRREAAWARQSLAALPGLLDGP